MPKIILNCLALVVLLTLSVPSYAEKTAKESLEERKSPAEQHELLATLEGDWDYQWRMWGPTGEEVSNSSGASKNAMIMDGRFLQVEMDGVMNTGDESQPFESLRIWGYDNVAQEYTSFGIDNTLTTMVRGVGSHNAEKNMIAEVGHLFCPVKVGKLLYRAELKFVSENAYDYIIYSKDDADQEYKMIEINYTK